MTDWTLTDWSKALLANPMYHWTLCGLPLGEGECSCALRDTLISIEQAAAYRAIQTWEKEVCRAQDIVTERNRLREALTTTLDHTDCHCHVCDVVAPATLIKWR